MINHAVCGLHFFNDASNNPRSKYKHEIARCNFWNSKYMVEIELGENDTALVQFQQNTPRLNLKNLSAAPRSFWDCLGVFCSKPSRQSQKPLGCASRFLRLSRGFWVHILLVSKITSCDFIYKSTVGVLIVAMGQGGCHAQQIEKNYSPSKRIKRRSNFVRLLKIIFFCCGVPCGDFPSKSLLFNPCRTNKKNYSPSKNKEEEQFC